MSGEKHVCVCIRNDILQLVLISKKQKEKFNQWEVREKGYILDIEQREKWKWGGKKDGQKRRGRDGTRNAVGAERDLKQKEELEKETAKLNTVSRVTIRGGGERWEEKDQRAEKKSGKTSLLDTRRKIGKNTPTKVCIMFQKKKIVIIVAGREL